MGKKWDRLDGVGSGGATFTKDGMNKGFKALPSYSGNPNLLCLNCKGSQRGRDRKGFKVCRCSNPSFPNVGKAQGERVSHWHLQWLSEAYRVLQPGGIIKAFSGTRTYHRLAAAMEEAGFTDIRLEAWTYGSGFPKSLNVSKAIDKHFGKTEEREVVGTSRGVSVEDNQGYGGIARGGVGIEQKGVDLDVMVGATEEARQYEGWGTACKPSWEPVLVGRKPTL